MLESVRRASRVPHAPHAHTYLTLTVHKAINLLDKLYDTFFAASRKSHVRLFTKHFIKIEFLDKLCRPIFKEFDEWPAICLDPDPPKDKRDKRESPENIAAPVPGRNTPADQKMTRKGRARKEAPADGAGGYCEMCNTEYADAGAHRRSPHHRAFVRDANNFLALDSLIAAGADVAAFLDKAAPVNGERRSQRHMCNGEPRARRANGHERHYYKVVGVGTKLRSGGGFARRRDSPPAAEPLVVKFRKVRRSELSVLSDEAEQFMFPKRASSSSSSDEEAQPSPAPAPPPAERRRLARPLALKEDSSEEDGWPEDARRRKRRAPAPGKRGRRAPCRTVALELAAEPAPVAEPAPPPEPAPVQELPPAAEASPLREEAERCMRWEDGRLKYTPAVEQLEFAFESVPRSQPWYETFSRQDQDKVLARDVPKYFALYSTAAPKLPYELGQLPPLKPNCCALSDLSKPREEKAGPSRAYGTRGMKKQKIRKRTAALMALEGHPRKSPREHASTLAILGSAGLLQRRKPLDDAKSTASEDTVSDTHSGAKPAGEARDASERLQRFLADVFLEADELEACEAAAAVTPAHNAPDLSSLLSECDARDPLRDQLQDAAAARPGRPARRARVKKKNRTGWPSKKKQRKGSRTDSSESSRPTEPDEAADEDTRDSPAGDAARSPDATLADATLADCKSEESSQSADDKTLTEDTASDTADGESGARSSRSVSSEDRELRKKRRALQGLCDWLPVVRVARVDPAATRRLRSAARARSSRLR